MKFLNTFQQMINTPMEPPKTQPDRILRKDNCVIVEFYIDNQKFQVYLPKDNKLSGKEVYLIKENQKEIKLLQPRGTKYMLTAKELGGIAYKIYDKETDTSITIDENNLINLVE